MGSAALVAALVLAAVAVGGDDPVEGVVLEVERAVASTTPETVPPQAAAVPATTTSGPTTTAPRPTKIPPLAPPTTPPPAASAPTTEPAPTPDARPSPLVDLLGPRGTAIPPAIRPRVEPSALAIGDLELSGPVRAVGLEPDGRMEIPDETEIGWYRYGSTPGRPGATVLAAHVTWNRTIGPFHRLGDLEPGARVEVRLADDSVRVYEVVERTMYLKNELPRERIWRTTGDETLVLITCGGDFNRSIRRYRHNIVVYAVPIA